MKNNEDLERFTLSSKSILDVYHRLNECCTDEDRYTFNRIKFALYEISDDLSDTLNLPSIDDTPHGKHLKQLAYELRKLSSMIPMLEK